MLVAMRSPMRWVAATILILASASAMAVELSSPWKRDEVRRYRYEETGHAGGALVTLRSTFVERVRALRPNGGADLEVMVEALELCSGTPQRCERPALTTGVRSMQAAIDRKGRVAATRVPIVSIRNGHGRVALGDAHDGAAPGAKQDADLEVVPLRLFALLAFPDGNVAPGARVDRPLPLGVLRWTLAALDHEVARVQVTSDARPDLSVDVVARFSAGALIEARGTLIRWQPAKRNTIVVLQRQ